MKLKIIRDVGDAMYVDADTGQPDTEYRRMSEPVRILPAGTVPTPVDDRDLKYIRGVLKYDPSSKLNYLALILARTEGEDDDPTPQIEEFARQLMSRGDEHVLNYYVERVTAQRQAAWELLEQRRQASLRFWIFRTKLVEVDGWETASREEVVIAVKHKVLSGEKAFLEMQQEIELFEKLKTLERTQRDRPGIPDEVRIFVWRRDGGHCVRCGSDHNIEFDHIIPLARGGSNTARNIQILCESCNRSKGVTT